MAAAIEIREMTDGDLNSVSELSIRVRKDSWSRFESGFYPKELLEQELALYMPDTLSSYLGRGDRFAFVALEKERIIGTVLGKCESAMGVADLGWIGVDPQKQRMGVAGGLIAAACRKSKDAACHKIIAYTFALLEGANRMYRRYGFAKESEMKRHWLKLDFVMYSRWLD
jgi:RimJ/RimL family protein N-acetyltransferase